MSPRARTLLLPAAMTVLMLAALIGLGFWQLQRMDWKNHLLDRLAQNPRAPLLVVADARSLSLALEFRRVQLACAPASDVRMLTRISEINSAVPVPWLRCRLPAGGPVAVRLLPSEVPRPGNQQPVVISGVLRQWEEPGWQQKLAGVVGVGWASFHDPALSQFYVDSADALPDAGNIANSHFAYAVQWFAFAAVLALIFARYARRTWRDETLI